MNNFRDNNKRMVAFIVGSKPDAIFPDIEPDIIFAANGAIARVQQYRQKCKITGVISNYTFSPKGFYGNKTLSVLKGCMVDELITFSLAKEKESLVHPSDAGIGFSEYKFLSRPEEIKIRLHCYNKIRLVRYVLKNRGFFGLFNFLNSIVKGVRPVDIKISTGIFALAIYLMRECRPSDIYLIGIGFDQGSGHFYDRNKIYDYNNSQKSKHADKDIFYICNLDKKYKYHNLFFTDEHANHILLSERT